MDYVYTNRTEAGRKLAEQLHNYAQRPDVIVFGLPRGGVPIAFEISSSLGAELDIFLVRKLRSPGQPELAMGALAQGGTVILNDQVIDLMGISKEMIDREIVAQQEHLSAQMRLLRGNRVAPEIKARTVILVDDGIATGASMRVAITALKKQSAAEIIVAVPVAPANTLQVMQEMADTVVCPLVPHTFFAVGEWYRDFSEVTDTEVSALLRRAQEIHKHQIAAEKHSPASRR